VRLRRREQLRPRIPCRRARLQALALTLEVVQRPDVRAARLRDLADPGHRLRGTEDLADRVGRRPVLPLLRARRELRGRVRVSSRASSFRRSASSVFGRMTPWTARPTTSASGPFGFASSALPALVAPDRARRRRRRVGLEVRAAPEPVITDRGLERLAAPLLVQDLEQPS
jgi:hypothetical protein